VAVSINCYKLSRAVNRLEVDDLRSAILLLTLMLLGGCATSKPAEDEFVTRVGVINGKDVIDSSQSSNNNTHVSSGVSVSSDRGVSGGIGVLLGSLGMGSSAEPSVRYHVDLMDGEQITIYHESDQFLAGDCVEIRSVPGNDSYPPQMKRIAGDC
jgi:hypothetical protein